MVYLLEDPEKIAVRVQVGNEREIKLAVRLSFEALQKKPPATGSDDDGGSGGDKDNNDGFGQGHPNANNDQNSHSHGGNINGEEEATLTYIESPSFSTRSGNSILNSISNMNINSVCATYDKVQENQHGK